MSIATPELKAAIRNLNLFVHRVESKQELPSRFAIKFDKEQFRRQELIDDEYDFLNLRYQLAQLFAIMQK